MASSFGHLRYVYGTLWPLWASFSYPIDLEGVAMRTIIAIVVLLALSAAGFAAKVTVDPNVPGASPAVEKPDDVDARLAEK
ncbi:MAG: hypothetical protein GX141_04995, partial [Armatimonadetes bacterium]|nr:hypothetical protein [Armatimonadota bacterium]